MGSNSYLQYSFRNSGAFLVMFYLGIFLILKGIGNSGLIWGNFSSWEPFSTLLLLAVIFFLYHVSRSRFNINFNSTSQGKSTGKFELIVLLLFLAGTPFLSVYTRQFELLVEPLSIFWGLLLFFLLIRLYGFSSFYWLLSIIFFAMGLAPLVEPLAIESNQLNHNMYAGWVYGLVAGIAFLAWSIADYLNRQSPPPTLLE